MQLRSKLVFLISFFSFVATGQVYDFQSMNQENGLPSSAINCITQDSRDLIWIGTDGAGLVRYDGDNFEIFNEGFGGIVTDIAENSNQNLVISTRYNGVYIFDGATFLQIIGTDTKLTTSKTYYKLLKTKKGIYCINENEIILIKDDSSLEKIADNNAVYDIVNGIALDENLNLILSANNGLFKVQNNHVVRLFPDVFKKYICLNTNLEGEIILGTFDGNVYKFKNNKPQFLKKIKLPNGKNYFIKQLFVGKSGSIWLGSNDKSGLCQFNDQFISFINEENGFDGENITCFYQDKSKELYIGTYGNGMYITGRQQFFSYKNTKELATSNIFSIYSDKDQLYVGIARQGVFEFKQNEDGKYILKNKFEKNYGTRFITKNNYGNIVFNNPKGLTVINNNNNNPIVYNLSSYLSPKSDIIALSQDKKNRYFLGTENNGLLIFDADFKFIIGIKEYNDLVSSNTVNTIDIIRDGKWYLGTTNGLYTLTENISNNFSVSKKIIDDVISISTKDKFSNYWFVGKDYIYVVLKNDKILKYGKKQGLSSMLIYTFISDKFGNLLVGTNLGIDKIEINENGKLLSIKNFNSKNGFKGLETNMRAQFLEENGTIFMGTAKGLYRYLPSYSHRKEKPAKIVLNNIKIFNQNQNWKVDQSKNKWFNIPNENHIFKATENQLTFQYNTINDQSSKNYLFSYKLEGVDINWSSPTDQKEVTYSNLNYGKYTFRLKLVDRLGNGANEESSYSFEIETPFYFKWWFIISILGFLMAILLIVFNKTSSYNKDDRQ